MIQETMKKGKKVLEHFTVPALVIMVALTVIVIASVPLALVWKEANITRVSREHDRLIDKKAAIHKDVLALSIKAKRLSSTERIEFIARESLGLDYPASDRITILRNTPIKENGPTLLEKIPLWALLRRSLNPEGNI